MGNDVLLLSLVIFYFKNASDTSGESQLGVGAKMKIRQKSFLKTKTKLNHCP